MDNVCEGYFTKETNEKMSVYYFPRSICSEYKSKTAKYFPTVPIK